MRSAALGGEALTELTAAGAKGVTFVPARGLVFARQATGAAPSVAFTHRDPVGLTESGLGAYDPLGHFIPFRRPADPRPAPGQYSSASMAGLGAGMADPDDYGFGCTMDGVPGSCSTALSLLRAYGRWDARPPSYTYRVAWERDAPPAPPGYLPAPAHAPVLAFGGSGHARPPITLPPEFINVTASADEPILTVGGLLVGGKLISMRPQGPEPQMAGQKPFEYKNGLDRERCRQLKLLLEREEKYGTYRAATMSSIETAPTETKLIALDNHPGIIFVDDQPIDQDWLMTLYAYGANPVSVAGLYQSGKVANDIAKAFNFAYGRNNRTQSFKHPIPYQEKGERNAVWAISRGKSFKDVFYPEWLKENCP